MSVPASISKSLDLRTTPLRAARSAATPDVSPDLHRAIEHLGELPEPMDRARVLAGLFRRLSPDDAVVVLTAAAGLADRLDPSGVRFLFAFLRTNPPGIEALDPILNLSSLERVMLKIASHSWVDPEETDQAKALLEILQVLGTASRSGAVDIGLDRLPGRATVIKHLMSHLRVWFRRSVIRLASGGALTPDTLRFLRDLGRLEVNFVERRVTRLARAVDPANPRLLHRLLTVLGFHRQDVVQMHALLDEIEAHPFPRDRQSTVEAHLPAETLEAVRTALDARPDAAVLNAICARMRTPALPDRVLSYFVTRIHQLARFRALALRGGKAPDLTAEVLAVLEHARPGEPLTILLEPHVAGSIEERFVGPGVTIPARGCFEIAYQESEALDYLDPDGLPCLDDDVPAGYASGMTLVDLVRTQIMNEPFLVGILANERARSLPGVVPLIAARSRSLRVLTRIARTRALLTGPNHRDVPRILLLNPAPVPLTALKPLIHVRFVTRRDLDHMERMRNGIRREVQQEVRNYLKTLRE